VHLNLKRIKTGLFEAQNSVFRSLLSKRFPIQGDQKMQFLGNKYSGYWFPEDLMGTKGTIWGVGLGFDSSFELELLKLGFHFHGFEPEIKCFKASLVEFEGTPAVIENYGLWDKSGKFRYTGENISIVNIFKLDQESQVELTIKSLWDVAKEKRIANQQSPRILKLNIEGAEREILLRFINDPLAFDVVIFQAEFLFHIGFKRIREKINAYNELKKILNGFLKMDWQVVDLTRHQITVQRFHSI
jgi:FkbM family methyltransferase